MKRVILTLLLSGLLAITAAPVAAGTAVPGHEGKTSGTVVGHYVAHYWEDANGDYVWDLGDGRGYSAFSGWVADESLGGWTGATVADLDAWLDAERAKLAELHTSCETTVNYRGDFGDDPYLDMGVIQNHDRCMIEGKRRTFNAMIVHESDPRYEGDPDNAIWGTWEYHVKTESGVGNLARPMHAVGSES